MDIDLGAEEIDMVMNIPALENGEEQLFIQDVEGRARFAEYLAPASAIAARSA